MSPGAARSSREKTARIAAERPAIRPNSSRSDSGIWTWASVSSKRRRLRPRTSSAPSASSATWTRTPSTRVPFLLERSRISTLPSRTAISQWKRDRVGSRSTRSADLWVPITVRSARGV